MCLLLHFLDEGTFQIVTQYSRNCFASLQENMFEEQEPSVKYGNYLICLGTLPCPLSFSTIFSNNFKIKPFS